MKEIFSLKQKRLFGGKKEFIVTKDREIIVREKYGINFTERTISIFDLDDKLQVVSNTSWFPMLMTLCFIGFCVGFSFAYINTGDIFQLLWLVPWGIAALISLGFFFKGHSKFAVVRFYQSEKIAMLIWRNNPNVEEFTSFTENLKEIIRKTKIHPQMPPMEKAKYFVDQIAFLEQEGVLSEDEARKLAERTIKRAEKQQPRGEVLTLVK